MIDVLLYERIEKLTKKIKEMEEDYLNSTEEENLTLNKCEELIEQLEEIFGL